MCIIYCLCTHYCVLSISVYALTIVYYLLVYMHSLFVYYLLFMHSLFVYYLLVYMHSLFVYYLFVQPIIQLTGQENASISDLTESQYNTLIEHFQSNSESNVSNGVVWCVCGWVGGYVCVCVCGSSSFELLQCSPPALISLTFLIMNHWQNYFTSAANETWHNWTSWWKNGKKIFKEMYQLKVCV